MFIFEIFDLLFSILKLVAYLFWIALVCIRASVILILYPWDWAAHRFDDRLPHPNRLVAQRWARLMMTARFERDDTDSDTAPMVKNRID